MVDTGVLMTFENQHLPYTFTLAFNPAAGTNGTFDVTIFNGTSTVFTGTGYNLGTCPSDDEHGPYTRQTTGNLLFAEIGMKDSGDSTNNRLWSIDAIHATGTAPPAPGGMTLVAAHFNGGNSTSVVDGYKGMGGDGWDGPWTTFDWRVIPANTVVSPGDEGFSPLKSGSGAYLKMTNTGENPDPPPGGHGKSGVGRDYARTAASPGINWTEAHTIKFTVRIDEDIAGGGTFNTSLDRYQIYDSSTPCSNIDATSVWAVQACGAADGSAITEDMVGEWIFTYGNGSGGTGGYADSNIDIVYGGVYDFTIVVDPTTQTYDATVKYGETTFTAQDLVWKTASDVVGGSITFMSVITTKDEVRAWSIDELIISQGVTVVPGDTNGDGVVNETDATTVADNWGRTDVTGPSEGDFNGDHAVNAADASIMAANWHYGVSEATGSAVPEPSLVALLGLTVLAMFTRRRGR
jgi:hypothetical protein